MADKVYRFAPLTRRVRRNVERWLEGQALALIERHKGLISEAGCDALVKQHVRDVAAGKFSFGGEAFVKAMDSWDGVLTVLLFHLQPNHPDITQEEVESLMHNHHDGVKAGLSSIVAEARKRAGGINRDPGMTFVHEVLAREADEAA